MSQTDVYPAARPATCPFDPPPEYSRRQEEAPISRMKIWNGTEVWLLTRYADVRFVLRDRRFSADMSRPNFPMVRPQLQQRSTIARTFIRMDDPDHAYFRRMLTREFMLRRIESIRPAIEQIVDGFLDEMAERRSPVDLVESLALPVPSMVICNLLGVPYEDHAYFQQRTQTLLHQKSSVEQVRTASDELLAYLGDLVDQKATDPGDDLLGRLITDQERPGNLDREDLVSMALLLLVAGHETTANMIGLGTLALLENPDQAEQIRADRSVIPLAVEELLRYLTIVQSGIPRLALEDVEVDGQTIRAGDGVVAMLSVANRDPDHFDAPDHLDIDRNARHHVAFGYGVHQCLGQPLARMELQIVLDRLFTRFPTLRLAVPVEEVRMRHDMFIYGVHELPVAW